MKKEFYRRKLPHYNTPGQEYYVTMILNSSVPKTALKKNALELETAKNQLNYAIYHKEPDEIVQLHQNKLKELKKAHSQKIEKILHNEKNPVIDFRKNDNLNTIIDSLQFWNKRRIENIAWSIMPNHIHWVFYLMKENEMLLLQKILHSVKLFTAREINKNEGKSGRLWSEESFDTTNRNENHLYNVINYTLNNPVKAKFVKLWSEWKGNYINPDYLNFINEEFGK